MLNVSTPSKISPVFVVTSTLKKSEIFVPVYLTPSLKFTIKVLVFSENSIVSTSTDLFDEVFLQTPLILGRNPGKQSVQSVL
jgi:hypothetical protein